MAWMKYTTTEFRKPQPINSAEYYRLKRLITQNPNFEVITEGVSFSEHFQGHFKMIGIGLVGGPIILIYVLELVDGTWLVPIFAIAGIFMFFGMGIMGTIQLFMEAPSYAKYKKKEREYFQRMKMAIEQTDVYDDFVNSFYIR
jgi:hypothetical protein